MDRSADITRLPVVAGRSGRPQLGEDVGEPPVLVAPRVLGDVEDGEDEVVGESDGVTRRGRNRASSYPNRRPSQRHMEF